MRFSEAWKKWRLIIKLDPDKHLPSRAFKVLSLPAVDAVVVGGTQGISYDNSAGLIEAVRRSGYHGPLIQEITAEDAVVPGVDAHLIPVVLNSADTYWLIDAHISAIKKYGNLIGWENILAEGYLVCNPGSAVGRLTGVKGISVEDAVAYTHLAENIFNLPVLYIEYSGIFGDMELVGAVARAKKNIQLFYGGGIRNPDQLISAASLVDTVIIGNIIYDSPGQAVEMIKSIKLRTIPANRP